MIELHMVTWNRPKITELVLKTIRRNINSNDYILKVWDNGSDKETVDMLGRMLEGGYIDLLIPATENVGLEEARQQLLTGGGGTITEFFVDIDNDCLPPKNWLQDQVDLMYKYEDYAAISQRTQVMIGTGNIFEETDVLGKDLTDFEHPGGSFRMMRTSAVLEVGGWDRGAPGRGSEERYICGKLRSAGYKTAFANKIQCLHLFGLPDTDRWGYDKDMKPEETGHSDIWHPALANGDDPVEIKKYSGKVLTDAYCNNQKVS